MSHHKENMKMKLFITLVLMSFLLTACNFKENLKEVGDSVQDGVQNIGEAVKDAPADISKASNKVEDDIKK